VKHFLCAKNYRTVSISHFISSTVVINIKQKQMYSSHGFYYFAFCTYTYTKVKKDRILWRCHSSQRYQHKI